MKKILFKLFTLIILSSLTFSCEEDNNSVIDGLPDAVVNDDPEGSPPRGLIENWNGHDETVLRQFLSTNVGVYYDPEVDRSIEWAFQFLNDAWGHTRSTYGDFGSSALYIVAHGEQDDSFYKTYFESESGSVNLIDFSLLSDNPSGDAIDEPARLMSLIVENANNGVLGSPGSMIWGDAFKEIYIYDLYLALGLDQEAQRVKSDYLNSTYDTPNGGTYWFRDWLLPIYENYSEGETIANFFKLLSNYYPIDGISYARDMNIGEIVHFFSGATGEDLEPLAIEAFGFNDADKNLLLQARAEFPELNYPFEPASEIIDVTSEANAAIVVSKDNDGGATAGEGSLKLIDNDITTKFLTGGFPQTFWMQQNLETASVVNRYTFTSGNDAPERDLKSWDLQGSNDGINFVTLDTRTDQVFTERRQTKEFTFENDTPYLHYRVNVIENNGSSLIQLSEWRLINLKLLSFGPEDVTDLATLTVNQENSNGANSNEGSSKLIDGSTGTKFLVFNVTFPLNATLTFQEAYRVTKYSMTSANDAPGRDPTAWTLQGSNDNVNFVDLDTRQDQSFSERDMTVDYFVNNEESYLYYRLSITANGGDSLFQLAEWRVLAE
ncbi:discoidin domain-containing protein [Flavivirga sp. 57AJ16]|uniref:discoidin domain-containing protein n=1 Tax=Flavivirga sp. 57AJ16 TaxID=3025307 RepID=UPI00236700C3|nr:discoidin domain-containing protein [Flavivirga sp. 57AJ16]MDD7887545.1 discoidin domain-containing protein [Flavivirga sp. 57AJ16]